MVEDGFAPSVIEHFIHLGLQRSEIETIILPMRTLERRRSQYKKLSTTESECLIRMVRVLAFAVTVFGERQKALHWLRKPKRRFDGHTPFSLLRMESGAHLVEEMLGKIDHEMFA